MIKLWLSGKPDGPLGKTSLSEDTDGQSLSGPPTNDLEMAPREAHIQGLIGAILEDFPPKINWSNVELCTQKEGEHLKTFVKHSIQAFSRHNALNPEFLEH